MKGSADMKSPIRLLAASAVVVASALMAPVSAAQAVYATPIRVAQSFVTGGLDPAQGGNGWALQSHGVMEPLFTVAVDLTVQPLLAQGFERIDGGLRVWLKPGLRFADGSALDADAVARALTRTAQRSSLAASRTGKLSFTVHSASEFSVRSEKPVGRMEAVLAEFPFVIYGERDGGQFVGSGRYALTAFKPGEPLLLQPNVHYRDGAPPRAVQITRMTEPESLLQGLEFGDIDLAFNVPAERAKALAADKRFKVHGTLVAYQYMLLVNTKRPVLLDVRVRRALSLALDRNALASEVDGEPASGLYPSIWPFAQQTPLAQNLVAARALLDDAGWRADGDGQRRREGQPLSLRLAHYPQRPDFARLAPLVTRQLAALGISVQAEASTNINQTMGQRDFDLAFWTMNTAPGGDPTYVLDQYFSSLGTIAYPGWQSLEFDDLLEAARRARDPEAVQRSVAGIERLLAAEAPAIFLLTPRWFTVTGERLRSYRTYPSDYYIVNGSVR